MDVYLTVECVFHCLELTLRSELLSQNPKAERIKRTWVTCFGSGLIYLGYRCPFPLLSSGPIHDKSAGVFRKITFQMKPFIFLDTHVAVKSWKHMLSFALLLRGNAMIIYHVPDATFLFNLINSNVYCHWSYIALLLQTLCIPINGETAATNACLSVVRKRKSISQQNV